MMGSKRSQKRASLTKRLLLSAFSLLTVVLVLEAATRIWVPAPAPLRLRDGVYVSQLALVNGRDTVRQVDPRDHPPLAEAKRPGEIRIFAFGESSVQGEPWEYFGSPPSMLYDQLRAEFPDRDLTVVNMGRGAAMTIDAYHFMVSIARFRPDFVVIYMGGNDDYGASPEMCFPANHPWLHRGWRFLVEHLRSLWSVRALGPLALTRWRGDSQGRRGGDNEVGPCDPDAGFHAWTDILVSTAQGMGARVITTTPVESALSWREGRVDRSHVSKIRVADKDESYRKVLACALTSGCDVPAFRANPGGSGMLTGRRTEARGRIWMDVSARRGAYAIDFREWIDTSPTGPFPPFFVDAMHLALGGYWTVAWLWSTRLAPLLRGETPSSDPSWSPEGPPQFDVKQYLDAVVADGRRDASCIMLYAASAYLRSNQLLVAGGILHAAIAFDAPVAGALASTRAGVVAQLVRGRLLRDVGAADPALPARLQELLGRVDLDEIVKELQSRPDCSSAGTGLVESLVVAPPRWAETPPTPPLGEAERALLVPLHDGSTLAGFDVAEIRSVDESGLLRIVCKRAGATVRLEIALAGEGGPAPPARAGRYAIFYALENAPPKEGERLASALATILTANAGASPPPRMRPFTPTRLDGTADNGGVRDDASP
jgi:hypothetical protein